MPFDASPKHKPFRGPQILTGNAPIESDPMPFGDAALVAQTEQPPEDETVPYEDSLVITEG